VFVAIQLIIQMFT